MKSTGLRPRYFIGRTTALTGAEGEAFWRLALGVLSSSYVLDWFPLQGVLEIQAARTILPKPPPAIC